MMRRKANLHFAVTLVGAITRLTAFLLCALPSPAQPPLEEHPPEGLQLNPAKPTSQDAAATVVVFNENDPESALLAKFYAEKRSIPSEQLVALHCSTREEISRAEYERGWIAAVDALVASGALRPVDAAAMRARVDDVGLPF